MDSIQARAAARPGFGSTSTPLMRSRPPPHSLLRLGLLLTLFTQGPAPSAEPASIVRSERIAIIRGAAGAVVQDRVHGREIVDYVVHAGAGQTLSVVMSANHAGAQFNVTPPDSEQAMFIGSISGRRFDAVAPVDGDYTLRVALPRAAARRDEAAVFALHVGVLGPALALAPTPSPADASGRGTPFHARASVPCSHFLKTAVTQCQAFVTRRVGDGNATVEVRWPDGARRRVLFLKGVAVATDAADPLSVQRVGEGCQLRLGNSERIEISDALLRGG
jgi:hypothetical protein